MLFAAGFGTRMGELTKNRPKPLIEVAGKALIDHALDQVESFRDCKIVANTHYMANQIEAHLQDRSILITRECPDILDTGGGLRNALPLLGDDPVFTMNTDSIWSGPNPLCVLANAWNEDEMDALLLCIPRNNAFGHKGKGDFLIDAHGLAARGPGAIYSGLQIIKTNGLSKVPQRVFSLNLLWDQMLARNAVHAIEYPGRWCDVGSPEGVDQAKAMLAGGDV